MKIKYEIVSGVLRPPMICFSGQQLLYMINQCMKDDGGSYDLQEFLELLHSELNKNA